MKCISFFVLFCRFWKTPIIKFQFNNFWKMESITLGVDNCGSTSLSLITICSLLLIIANKINYTKISGSESFTRWLVSLPVSPLVSLPVSPLVLLPVLPLVSLPVSLPCFTPCRTPCLAALSQCKVPTTMRGIRWGAKQGAKQGMKQGVK